MNKMLLVALMVVIGAGLMYFAQSGSASFGFEKNLDVRKSADAESVAGCMQSCEDMLAGWLEMNPDSQNYSRQWEKIEAKAQQCLGMNELAGSPFSQETILASCGLSAPHCTEIPLETPLDSGACASTSFIKEANLPQCCGIEGPLLHGMDCGADAEWVAGVAAYPVCYVLNS